MTVYMDTRTVAGSPDAAMIRRWIVSEEQLLDAFCLEAEDRHAEQCIVLFYKRNAEGKFYTEGGEIAKDACKHTFQTKPLSYWWRERDEQHDT